MGSVLAWMVCLRGWRAIVGGVLSWVAWVTHERGLRGWRASMGDVPVRMMWVVYVYVCMCALFRFGVI